MKSNCRTVTGNPPIPGLSQGTIAQPHGRALRLLVVLHFYDIWGIARCKSRMLIPVLRILRSGDQPGRPAGLGARLGLNRNHETWGSILQVEPWLNADRAAASLTVPWVMAAQALSEIARNLNKMSAKTAVQDTGFPRRPRHTVQMGSPSLTAFQKRPQRA